MRRTTIFLVLLALTGVLAASGVRADDWSDAVRSYKRDILPDNPINVRLGAVRSVGVFGTKEAARILLSTVAITERSERELLEEKEKVEDQLQKILGSQQFDEKRTIPADAMNTLKSLQARLDRLQQQITDEARIRQEIGESLATFEDEKAVEFLLRDALRDRSERVREIAAMALGGLGREEAVEALVKALGDRSLAVRQAALLSLGKIGAREALVDILGALRDEAWPIRAAAVKALGAMRLKECVGPLIEALDREEGRLQRDIADVLEDLTGQKFGTNVESWRHWWDEHKGEFGGEGGLSLGGKGSGRGPGVTYYGIETHSKRIVYVLDVSGSMSRAHDAPDREAQEGEKVKVEAAKAELIRSLRTIPKDGAFTIIVYNDLIQVWKPKLVPASEGNKKEAEAYVSGLTAASSTNIYGALEAVFKLAGMGVSDRNYDIGADTVFLLTDGSPTKPDGTPDSTEKILIAAREWNRLERVTIHCIGIGRAHNGGFLMTLAREHGGQYVAR